VAVGGRAGQELDVRQGRVEIRKEGERNGEDKGNRKARKSAWVQWQANETSLIGHIYVYVHV